MPPADAEIRFYEELGQRIQRARRKRGLTQASLASAVGLTRTSIVNVEKGRQKLLAHTVVALSHALDLRFDELLPNPLNGAGVDELLRDRPKTAQDFVRSVIAVSRKRA